MVDDGSADAMSLNQVKDFIERSATWQDTFFLDSQQMYGPIHKILEGLRITTNATNALRDSEVLE
jgi:hypothetical protein